MPTQQIAKKLIADGYDVTHEDVAEIKAQIDDIMNSNGSLCEVEEVLLDYSVDLDYLLDFLL